MEKPIKPAPDTQPVTAPNGQPTPKYGVVPFLLRLLQGALIGLGAVLPGISGGVLCVIFGVYAPMMELLSHPLSTFKKNVRLLLPIVLGIGLGFLGISRILAFFLNTYPDQSVCLFAGLIFGMLPSLFREAGEKGRSRGSFVSLGVAFAAVLTLLCLLNSFTTAITPNIGWYVFCGFCMGLSIIAPGMSFSTLLMPLGLYTPLVDGIGKFDLSVLIPAGIGALLTILLLARAVNHLMERHYSLVFHAIIGIVTAATVVIVPFASFAGGVIPALQNLVCLTAGIVCAVLLDRFNSRFEKPEV